MRNKMPGYIDAGKRIKIVKVGEIRVEGKKTIPIAETENNDERKITCRVCEKITDANKDIFWTFARTHQPEDRDEFRRVPARFCPACGREIVEERKMEPWEEKENRS